MGQPQTSVFSRLTAFAAVLLGGLWPSPVVDAEGLAPWDGIVGFLRTVAALQGSRAEPEAAARAEPSDGESLRKIVYAVEEPVASNDTEALGGAAVLYDSLANATSPEHGEDFPAAVKRKRSAEASADESGRDVGVVGRPYFIGRKLWYVPLWFGVYFILYITALTVKSVARHRIKYPTLVSEDAIFLKRRNDVTRRVTGATSNTERRYQQGWSM